MKENRLLPETFLGYMSLCFHAGGGEPSDQRSCGHPAQGATAGFQAPGL